jgi:hypothetical protein
VVTLPPGYESAIVDNLAVDLCSSFGVQSTRDMILAARNSRAALVATNHVPIILDTGLPLQRGDFRISERF